MNSRQISIITIASVCLLIIFAFSSSNEIVEQPEQANRHHENSRSSPSTTTISSSSSTTSSSTRVQHVDPFKKQKLKLPHQSPGEDEKHENAPDDASGDQDEPVGLYHRRGLLFRPGTDHDLHDHLQGISWIDNNTLMELRRSVHSSFYNFDEDQQHLRTLPLVVTMCGKSKDPRKTPIMSNSYEHTVNDCARILHLLTNIRVGVGHFMVYVRVATPGDEQWLAVLMALERSFPGRFTVLKRDRKTSCSEMYSNAQKLGFRWLPNLPGHSDRIFFLSVNFNPNPSRDVLKKFALFSRLDQNSFKYWRLFKKQQEIRESSSLCHGSCFAFVLPRTLATSFEIGNFMEEKNTTECADVEHDLWSKFTDEKELGSDNNAVAGVYLSPKVAPNDNGIVQVERWRVPKAPPGHDPLEFEVKHSFEQEFCKC